MYQYFVKLWYLANILNNCEDNDQTKFDKNHLLRSVIYYINIWESSRIRGHIQKSWKVLLGKNALHFLQSLPVVAYSSSSPLLSLVTSTSEISHQPVHTYTTYIWQQGRQNRRQGMEEKYSITWGERGGKKKSTPRLCSIWGVQCENRKKHPAQKHIHHKHMTLQHGETYPALASSRPVQCHLLRCRSQTRLDSLAVQSGRRQLIGGGE